AVHRGERYPKRQVRKVPSMSVDTRYPSQADLDYVLENVVDPSSVVGKDYRLNVFVTRKGGIVSGLIEKETESALMVRTVDDLIVLPKRDIVQKTIEDSSMMPEGLLSNLSDLELHDLLAYLKSKAQVPLRGVPYALNPRTQRVDDALEGESLKIVKREGGITVAQNMTGFGRGRWSGNHQLWWRDARPGNFLEL
ncbi:MAG: hypothetical protein AAF517_22380, partial [Planctomycetota bacterium]